MLNIPAVNLQPYVVLELWSSGEDEVPATTTTTPAPTTTTTTTAGPTTTTTTAAPTTTTTTTAGPTTTTTTAAPTTTTTTTAGPTTTTTTAAPTTTTTTTAGPTTTTTTSVPGGGFVEGYLRASDDTYLYIQADNDVVMVDLKATYDDVFLTTATVTAQVRDSQNNDVGPPATMTYQAGTNAEYYGIIERAVTNLLVENEEYFIDVNVVQGSYEGFRRLKRLAAYHGSRP